MADEMIGSEFKIFGAIAKVMAEIGAVGKDSKNVAQGYQYRGIDAIMNALQPALIKAKVFVYPQVLEHEREERVNAKGTTIIYSMVKVRYVFQSAEDGSSVSAIVIGEGMDSGDKSYNKALSAAYKYACFQTLCIPTEEMIDSEVDDHEVQPKKKADKPAKENITKMPTGQTEERINALLALAERAKVKEVDLLAVSGVKDLKVLSDVQYEGLVKKLNKTIESKGL